MSIEELISVVPPPRDIPKVGGLRKWKSIEHKMGIQFPDDYREFAMRYGPGSFANPEIVMLFPFDADYDDLLKYQYDVAVALREEDSEPVTWLMPVYPEKNGLLSWGKNANAYYFYWIRKGTPEKWWIGVRDRDGFRREFKMSLTTFLAKVMGRRIQPKICHESEYAGTAAWAPRVPNSA